MKNRNGKLFVILAAVLLLVMSFAISTFAGDSQNYWVTQSLNVSTYRANTDTNGHYTKYPSCTLTGYEGYVFAGWFTDETCETPYTKATGTAYAKFVPEEIFGTKAQVLGTLVDDDRTNDETGAIRFVTSVDSLDYLGIGFEVYYNGATTPSYISTDTTTVYQNLYAVGKAGTGKAQAFDATVFHANSQYLKTVTFTELPAAKYAKTLEAKPFWITLDGTKVVADGDVRCVNEGRKYIVVNATAAQNGVGTEKSPFNNLEDAMALATRKNKVAETDGVDAVVYLKSNVTANKEYAMDNNKKVVIQSSKAVTITRGDAIAGDANGDTEYDVFAVNTGTLSIQGTATNKITVEGNAKDSTTANVRAFAVASGATLDLDYVIVQNFTRQDSGGAFHVAGTVTVDGGSIANNEASVNGGAFYVANTGRLTIGSGTISHNTAKVGGAVAMASGGTAKTTINGGSITGNTATGNGGAINVLANSTLTVNGGTISGNNCTGADAQKGVRIHAATSVLNISDSAYIDYIYLQDDASAITLTGDLTGTGNMTVLCKNYKEGRTIIKAEGSATTANTAKFKLENNGKILKQSEDKKTASLYLSEVWNQTKDVGYESLNEAVEAVTDSAATTLVVQKDLTQTAVVNIGDSNGTKRNITIIDDGTAHTISRGTHTGRFFRVYSDSALTLTTTKKSDKTPLLVLDGSYSGTTDLSNAQFVYSQGTLNMDAGVVMQNNSITAGGGAINVNTGTTTINGGLITGNETTGDGGAIHVNGTVSVKGGTITKNKCGSEKSGGAFYLTNAGDLTIEDGVISNNQARTGGAITMVSGGTAETTINGGSITGNTATGYSGAIHVAATSTLNVNGGTISGNKCTANPLQKGIRVHQATSVLNMSGAAYADYIYLQNSSVINLTGNLTTTDNMVVNCGDYVDKQTVITGTNYITDNNIAKFQIGNGNYELIKSDDQKTAVLYLEAAKVRIQGTGTTYLTLPEAMAALNTAGTSTATVEILSNIALDDVIDIGSGSTYENVTNLTIIDGGKKATISRDSAYTGRFFRVRSGATLTFTTTTKSDSTPLLTLDGTSSSTLSSDAQFVYTQSFNSVYK